ncbi:hypothetical protein HRbin09_02106 [bacterium HR09]|nr:hypothetical protein HRbin09_02106 [bacterium HR09]
MRGDPQAPQSFNLYAYVRNNPLMLTDPWGTEAAPGAGSPCSYPEGDEACKNAAKNAAQTEAEQAAKETTSLLPRFYESVEVRASALDVEGNTLHAFVFAAKGAPDSQHSPGFSLVDFIAANTDFGFSASLYFKGWSWSADQWGARGDGRWWVPSDLARGVTTNTQSWVVGADVFVFFGSDRLRAINPPSTGRGSGFPGVGRFPGVEIVFGKDHRIVGVALHWGSSFFFPPGWVTGY